MVPRKILDSLIKKQIVEPGRKHCIHYTDENGKECKCTLAKMTKDRAFFVEEPCSTEESNGESNYLITAELNGGAHIFSVSYVIRSLKDCIAWTKGLPREEQCTYLAVINIIRAGYDLFESGYAPDYCAWICTNLIFGAVSNNKRKQEERSFE